MIRSYMTIMLLLVLGVTSGLFAGQFTVKDGDFGNSVVNTQVNGALNTIAGRLNEEPIVQLAGDQDDLALGMANATSSNSLTGAVLTGSDVMVAAGSVGVGAAVEAPANVVDMVSNAEDGTDTYVGAAVAPIVASGVVNGDLFLPMKGFLFEVRTGGISETELMDGLTFSAFMIGAGVRYKVINMPSTPFFKVRDLTVGTGMYYISSSLQFESDPITEEQTDNGIAVESETVLNYGITNKTFVIPVEWVSSASLGPLGIIGGAGFDFVFGETVIECTQDTDITITDRTTNQAIAASVDPELVLSDADTTANPTIFRPKLVTGLTVNIGPVALETPVCIYPATGGYSASIVVGGKF